MAVLRNKKGFTRKRDWVQKNAFVAMDFSDVPITEGIYANLFDSSPEGGDAV